MHFSFTNKILLILSLGLLQSLTSFGSEVTLLNLNNLSYGKNNVFIYGNDSAIKSPNDKLFTAPLLIFDNPQLSGEPILKITNEDLTFQGNTIKLADFFTVKIKNIEYAAKSFDLSFLKKKSSNLFIEVEDYKEGIATIKLKNGNYYFKINKHSYFSQKWPGETLWAAFVYNDNVKIVKNLIQTNAQFKALFEKVKKCLDEKSKTCLVSVFGSNADLDDFEKELRVASVVFDKELCNEFEKINDYAIPDSISDKVKSFEQLFLSLKKVLSLENPKAEIYIKMKDFEKYDHISFSIKRSNLESICDYGEELVIRFRLSDKGWGLSYIGMI